MVTVGRSRPVLMAVTVRPRGGLPVLLRCRSDGGGGRGLDLQVVREGALLLGLRGGGRCGLVHLSVHHQNIVSRTYSFGCCSLSCARLGKETRDACCARAAWPSSASSLTLQLSLQPAVIARARARPTPKTLFYPLSSARPYLCHATDVQR